MLSLNAIWIATLNVNAFELIRYKIEKNSANADTNSVENDKDAHLVGPWL